MPRGLGRHTHLELRHRRTCRAVAHHRHAVLRTYCGTPDQPLRFAATGDDPVSPPEYNGFQCLACPFAHGTNAAASIYAAGVDPTKDSALLYYDKRGACLSPKGQVVPLSQGLRRREPAPSQTAPSTQSRDFPPS